MSQKDAAYRLTVYAPRSVDPTETTVLTPRSGAPHSDDFKVATRSGVTGFKPYLFSPRGRIGRIDPLKKTTTTGQLSIEIGDPRNTAGGSNASRWVTAFLGDSEGRNQLNGCKVLVEESTDGGSNWNDYFTGRIHSPGLSGRTKYRFIIRDMADDLNSDIFVGRPHSDITYASMAPLVPNYPLTGYGMMFGASVMTGTAVVESMFSTTWAMLDSDHIARKFYNYIYDCWPEVGFLGTQISLPYSESVRVHLKITSGARSGEEGEFYFDGATTPIPGVRKDDAGHYRFVGCHLRELPSGDGDYLALPPDGVTIEFYIYCSDPPSKDLPLLIGSVHPVQLWKDILDGKFSRLNLDGTVTRSFAYDSSAFSSLIADLSIPPARFLITDIAEMNEWIEKNICEPFNLASTINESGQTVPIDMRLPSSLSGIPTLDSSDLYSDDPGSWEQSADSAITSAEITFYVDCEVPNKSAVDAPAGLISNSPVRIKSIQNLLHIQGIGNTDLNEEVLEIDGTGYRLTAYEYGADNVSRKIWLDRHLRGFLRSFGRPVGSGAAYARLNFQRVADVISCRPGDLRIINVDHLPNPGTVQRGGNRLMRCVEREDGPGITLLMLDMGLSEVASVPSATSPTQHSGDTKHAIDVAVTLNGSSEPVRVEIAITDTSTGTPPTSASGKWVYADTVTSTGTLTIERLPGNTRVWVRLRTEPDFSVDQKLPSAWAAPSPTQYVDTAAMTAPSNVGSANKTASTADISWTNGESGYDVEVLVVLGGVPGSWSDDDVVAVLAPGTAGYTLKGLDGPSTQHTVGIRHRDPNGGVSSVATHTFSTTATSPTAPRPAGLAVALLSSEPEAV